VPGRFAVDVASAEVQVYNSLGMLESHAHVKGTHVFSLNRHGVYIIRIENSNGDNVAIKYFHQ